METVLWFHMKTQVLRQKFSQAAVDYDRYEMSQQSCAEDLLNNLVAAEISPDKILDIGTGTGSLLKGLSALYPKAKIFALDIAYNMLDCARKKTGKDYFIQADSQWLPFRENVFDLVVSNLAFQWLEDVEKAFGDIFCLLVNNGVFSFTTFGPDTLREIKTIFPQLNEHFRLPYSSELEFFLEKAGFFIQESSVKIEKRYYSSLLEIIRWLKKIGANYVGYIPTKTLGARKLWQEKEDDYRRYFGEKSRVYASFEIISISAKK